MTATLLRDGLGLLPTLNGISWGEEVKTNMPPFLGTLINCCNSYLTLLTAPN